MVQAFNVRFSVVRDITWCWKNCSK